MQSSSKRNFPKGDRVTAAAGKKSIFQSRPRRPPHPRIFNSSPDVNETQPGGTNDRQQRQSASFGRRNHNFDPELYTLGVIVFASWKKADSAIGTSNDSSVPKNEYMVFPFCTGKAQPRELTLRCPELLKLGEWIRIENRDLQGGQVNPKTYQPHDEWFLTMPFLKSVAMECDILVFARIRTKTYKPNKPSKMPPVPFIQGIEDDLGLLQREHADMKVCATIVYQSGRWRIRHLKPRGFYQFY